MNEKKIFPKQNSFFDILLSVESLHAFNTFFRIDLCSRSIIGEAKILNVVSFSFFFTQMADYQLHLSQGFFVPKVFEKYVAALRHDDTNAENVTLGPFSPRVFLIPHLFFSLFFFSILYPQDNLSTAAMTLPGKEKKRVPHAAAAAEAAAFLGSSFPT